MTEAYLRAEDHVFPKAEKERRKRKSTQAVKPLPALIKEKETHWPK